MYESAIESALDYLIKTIEIEGPGSKRVTVIGERFEKDYLPVLEHLTCFSGAMVGLVARLLGRIDDLTLAFSVSVLLFFFFSFYYSLPFVWGEGATSYMDE